MRPYDSADAFIQAEGWTLSRRGAVLLDQAPLEPETQVRFDVSLRSGERLVLAEGIVVSVLKPNERRPGGLKVRFTRCGSSTKNFIERVLAALESSTTSLTPPVSSAKPAMNGSAGPPSSNGSGAIGSVRSGRAVPPPVNRDELLAQLRQRHAGRQAAVAEAAKTER